MIDPNNMKSLFIIIDDGGNAFIYPELNPFDGAEAAMVMQVVYCEESGATITKVLKNKWGLKG